MKTKGMFDFDPEKPVFLYPVRAIRRKNIFEAALIAMIAGNGGNLIQTLPGISDQEIKYSNLKTYKVLKLEQIQNIWTEVIVSMEDHKRNHATYIKKESITYNTDIHNTDISRKSLENY